MHLCLAPIDKVFTTNQPRFVRTEGIFALDEFFSAAQEAGIYLLARPGPYINSEVSGGGFPGWLQRNKAQLRSTDPEFLDATKKYIAHVGKIISEAQITKGGPVILLQPDNEYTLCSNSTGLQDISACLDKEFMQFVEDEYHEAGIMVPLLSNDAVPLGNFKPGSGVGEVDLYGFDFYPMSWGQQPCKICRDYVFCSHNDQARIHQIGIDLAFRRQSTLPWCATFPLTRVPGPSLSSKAEVLISGKFTCHS